MIYPSIGFAPPPNADMPERVQKLYLEAARISAMSPRAAAALLRLAVQVLCEELGEKERNINDAIAALVKRGLHPTVQQSLDIVRVTGNGYVHPGKIDTDDAGVVAGLFDCLNLIVDYMISMPKKTKAMYDMLPEDKKAQIMQRDCKQV
jgi:hypothetical protein